MPSQEIVLSSPHETENPAVLQLPKEVDYSFSLRLLPTRDRNTERATWQLHVNTQLQRAVSGSLKLSSLVAHHGRPKHV